MKQLFRYAHQPRRFADSEGFMLIELEDGEDRDAIIEQIHSDNKWYYSNTFIKEVESYEYNGKTYTGRLLLFSTLDGYTG